MNYAASRSSRTECSAKCLSEIVAVFSVRLARVRQNRSGLKRPNNWTGQLASVGGSHE